MTHTIESLEMSSSGTDWVATCSCHNPDGDGEGRADFTGWSPLEAVRAWQEHVDQQPDDLTIPPGKHYARKVPAKDGEHQSDARLNRYGPTGEVVLSIHSGGNGTYIAAHIYLTDAAWNTLRGVR